MNEINTSLQKLLNGKEKFDDDTDDADGQHDPYASAMLRRRHKNLYLLKKKKKCVRLDVRQNMYVTLKDVRLFYFDISLEKMTKLFVDPD